MKYEKKKKIKAAGAGILSVLLAAGLAGCQGPASKTVADGAKDAAATEEQSPEELKQIIVGGDGDTDPYEHQIEFKLDDVIQGSGQDSAQEPEQEPEKKEIPEGFELKFASEDWGLSFGEPGTQSVGNASAEDLAWYDAYYIGSDSEKIMYLTFDCGYENGNTEPILDALKKHNVKATFFVVGHFLETAPDMVKRMVEEGHAVGNHTYHHPDMTSISEMPEFQKEVDGVADLFQEITGTKLSPYYRPPQGKCNAANVKMAYELGYCTIFWSLAYVDWNQDAQPSHEEAFDKLTSRAHPGAVVLLHNTSQTNGEILDELLTKWENMGYSFRPLSELTGK